MKQKDSKATSPKQILKITTITYYAILLGPLGYLLTQYFGIKETKLEFTNTENAFQYIVPIAAILGYILGKRFYESRIKALKNKDTLLEKLNQYQLGFVFKLLLLEGPALLGIVAFTQDGNLYFLIISGILILLIALQKPNKINIQAVLNLSSEQRSQYNKPNEKLE